MKVTTASAVPEPLPTAVNVAVPHVVVAIVIAPSVTVHEGNASTTLSFVAQAAATLERKLKVTVEEATPSPVYVLLVEPPWKLLAVGVVI